MYLSLNWLKDFVQIPKKTTPEELGLRLTLHTVEVDAVIKQAEKYNNVVVGKILKVSKHPNADRLQIATVNVKKEVLEIVCGAPNIAAGQLVPVALVGAVLPNGVEIKEAEMRGVKSCGMLCAADELGLGNDHSGIIILDNKAKIGENLADFLGLKDIIFEVDNKSITNRPDLWSHMGMARDIAVFLNTKFTPYQPKADTLTTTDNSYSLKVKIEDKELCPRYMAIALSGLKIEPSPKWMQERLIAAEMRPINNIVDITNYVMLELGQPLHAFDQKLIDEIIVRRAAKEEAIETLDGNKRELSEEMLVIADSKKPVAVAGVMGGASSEISQATESIIIESANFNFVSVRKTSQKLGLRTESSMRFEKSLDPNLCAAALSRAVELVKEICPVAKVTSKLIDEKNFQLNQGPITLSPDTLFKIMGEQLKKSKAEEILTKLGFTVEKDDHDWKITIPTWRATKDISIKEDIVEEVARIYGYDNLVPVMPKIEMKAPEANRERQLERKIKEYLSLGAGLSETYNYSFVGEDQLKKIGLDYSNYIRLANPISSQYTMLRQSLSPNLFLNIKTNQARYDKIGIYEIGSVFLSSEGIVQKNNFNDEKLPYQEKRLGIILAGDNDLELYSELKGIIDYLAQNLNFEVAYESSEIGPAWSDKKFQTNLLVFGRIAGFAAKLDNQRAKNFGLKKEVLCAEINLGELLRALDTAGEKAFQEFEKFPSLVRDLAFVVNEKVRYSDLKDFIAGFNGLIRQVKLFDIYEGGKLGEDKKSLAFNVEYQADRTLTSEEVDLIQTELIKAMEEKFEAKLRNF